MSTGASEKKFSKILAAIDGSEPSMDAAYYAILMARLYNANLIALYSLPDKIRYEYEGKIDFRGIVELPRQDIEDKSFSKIKEKCKENNVNLITEVVTGGKSVAADIVDYAESSGVDLIVLGTSGRSGFKKLLLGSVASGVVTYAHCPVIIVK